MLGIFAMNPQAVEGSILQMVNHGLSTGALFLLVGMIYERRHTRMIEEFGGLSRTLPRFALCFLVVTMSSIGLPGLNGFVGEFLILAGIFRVHQGFAVLATIGIILAAVYMLRMWQRVMWGTSRRAENLTLNDIGPREMAILVPIILLIIWIGLNPNPLLRRMDASVTQLLCDVRRAECERQGAGWRVSGTGAGQISPYVIPYPTPYPLYPVFVVRSEH
jgi:NADH-quinone oxidoreductase subunit M